MLNSSGNKAPLFSDQSQQHSGKDGVSIWDTLVQTRDHMQERSTAVSIIQQFKHLTMAIRIKMCSMMQKKKSKGNNILKSFTGTKIDQ